MAEASEICVAILAAGKSQRFGQNDKLAAPLKGKMLGLHIADRLSKIDFQKLFVITTHRTHPCASGWGAAGFELAINTDAANGMGTSIAMAAKLAADRESKGLLICLADMPLVPIAHFRRMIDHFDSSDADACIASTRDEQALPPVIFGSNYFEQLAQLGGDVGARQFLANADLAELPPKLLVDIDDIETLNRLNADAAWNI